MHDRFWQVSDTTDMPISQKLWIKLRKAEFHIIRIKWKSIYLSIKGRTQTQEFPFFQESLKFLLSFLDFAAGKSSLNSDSYLRLEAIFGFGNTKTSLPFL